MYLHGMCFACAEKKSSFGSLGFDWWSAAGSLLNTKGGGQPSNVVTTTTTVATQVSPQISPVFVQQSNPEDSPVNAGAAMQPTGALPMTGALPGFDAESGWLPTGLPALPSGQSARNIAPYAIAALGILGLAFVVKKAK